MVAPAIAAALFGALIGSFLNVVAYRLPRGESLAFPASRCPACESPIRPYDNLPVLSWLLLRGRCRDCGAAISARYPLVELATAILFAAVVLSGGGDGSIALGLALVTMLIPVTAIDLEHRIVPNRILAPSAVVALVVLAVAQPDLLPEHLLAAGGAFLFLLLAALAHPAGMGMGDVKLAGTLGLYLGLAIVPALVVAFLAGSAVGLAMLAREGRAARKRGVPFAPFLALGALVALFAGPELIDAYSDRFLT